jgi:hypothetical protein
MDLVAHTKQIKYTDELAIIQHPFGLDNAYHNLLEHKSVLFSFLYSIGMFDMKTLSFTNEISKVKLYFPNSPVFYCFINLILRNQMLDT